MSKKKYTEDILKEEIEGYQEKLKNGEIINYGWLGAIYEMNGLDPKKLKNPFFNFKDKKEETN